MTIFHRLIAGAALAVLAAPAAPAADLPRSVVSIYHVAPGQHENFLKWLARQDEIAKAAGQKPATFYAHTDGDSWDYVSISPMTTDAQDKAFDEAARKMGVNPKKGGLEMRQYMASHTDTISYGPTTAADYLGSLNP